MFLFHSLHHGSFRRRYAQNVFALVALFFLFTALLFTGCKDEEGTPPPSTNNELDSRLIGTWTSENDDGYTITSTYLSYDDGYGSGYAGTIKYVVTSNNAGVIIIEYDTGHKPTYYDSFENYGEPDHILPLKGDFIGVYYKELKPDESVQMGTAYIEGGAEEPTLDAAKNAFTLDKEGDYVAYYGIYQQ